MRARDFRTELSEMIGSRHHHKIIVVLPDDTMGYVFDHLVDSCGVLAMPDGDSLDVAVFTPASAARIAVAVEDDAVAKIHRDSTASMLFTYLRMVDRIVVIEQVSARLVMGDPLVTC